MTGLGEVCEIFEEPYELQALNTCLVSFLNEQYYFQELDEFDGCQEFCFNVFIP